MSDASAAVKSPITDRETQVLQLLASGCTYCQIADRLGVSLHTVTSHIKNLYRKLGVRSAAAAVMRGMQLQLLAGQLASRIRATAFPGVRAEINPSVTDR